MRKPCKLKNKIRAEILVVANFIGEIEDFLRQIRYKKLKRKIREHTMKIKARYKSREKVVITKNSKKHKVRISKH